MNQPPSLNPPPPSLVALLSTAVANYMASAHDADVDMDALQGVVGGTIAAWSPPESRPVRSEDEDGPGPGGGIPKEHLKTVATFDQIRALMKSRLLEMGPDGVGTVLDYFGLIAANPPHLLRRLADSVEQGDRGAIVMLQFILRAAQMGVAHELLSIAEEQEVPE